MANNSATCGSSLRSCRFVYNKALALNLERYEKKEKRLGYAGLCALLPNWKMEHEFLSKVPAPMVPSV
jgi:putative transposase